MIAFAYFDNHVQALDMDSPNQPEFLNMLTQFGLKIRIKAAKLKLIKVQRWGFGWFNTTISDFTVKLAEKIGGYVLRVS